VDQTAKINRKPALTIWAVAGLLLLGLPCWISSAQEVDKSEAKTNKFASKLKQFVKRGHFIDPRINESSGVVVAAKSDAEADQAIWTINDSGGKPAIYRVGLEGQTEAILTLTGTKNRDWESMCSYQVGLGPKDKVRFLVVGDVGDNLRKRKSVWLHTVAEPEVELQTDDKGKPIVQQLSDEPESYKFTYDDGPHNVEAMGYNSEDATYWFVEKMYANDKRETEPGIYVLPDPARAGDPLATEKTKHVAKRIVDFPIRNVTGMAFSADNKKLVIRAYFGYYLFEKPDGKTWQEVMRETKPVSKPLPWQSQGEAICFSSDGQSLLVTSELTGAIIWQINLAQPDDTAGKQE